MDRQSGWGRILPEVKLPAPDNWSHRLGVAVLLGSVLTLSGALCAVWVANLVSRGEYPTAAFAIGLLPLISWLVLGLARVQTGRVYAGVSYDSAGTDFRSSRAGTVSANICVSALIASGIIFVWFSRVGRIEIPMNGSQRIYYPIAVGALVCWLVYCLRRAIVMGCWGYLKLSPHGFEVANVLHATAIGSWADVVNVVDEAPKGKNGRCPAVMVMKDGPPQVINSLDTVWPHGNALYWMIRHYWLHPENRGELANGRAIERLRAQDFEVE